MYGLLNSIIFDNVGVKLGFSYITLLFTHIDHICR